MSIITKTTHVTLDGHHKIVLRPTDYVTGGGEGAIYKKYQTIIKLYLDPKKMARDNMTDKIKLLAAKLRHPSIVAPQGLVLDNSGNAIGYHMPFVTGETLPLMFTNDWRAQHLFGNKETALLTAAMHDVVTYSHKAGALIVDGNELNWLADVSDIRRPVPYAIDVDSWQIDRFKATVMMPSIRDWHNTKINEDSDWFAWGIVSFLLFTGIHPYRGTLDGYKPGELEKRMKDNMSVFNPNVRLNKTVRDLNTIPGPLLEWYRATFSGAERTTPPSPLQTGATQTIVGRTMRMVGAITGGLIYEKLFGVTGDAVLSVWPCGVVRLASGSLIDLATKRKLTTVSGSKIALVKNNSGWLVAELISGSWHWRFIDQVTLAETKLSLLLPIVNIIRNDERLFVVTENELVELSLLQFSKPVLTIGRRWPIFASGTKWWSGLGTSDILGAMHLVIPYGSDSVAIIRVPELDGLTVVNAIAGNNYAEIITLNKNGDYEAHAISFDNQYKQYQWTSRIVSGPEQNLTILPKGVVARIENDDELVITVPKSGVEKFIADRELSTDMRLAHIGNQVIYRKDGEIWSLRMQ